MENFLNNETLKPIGIQNKKNHINETFLLPRVWNRQHYH